MWDKSETNQEKTDSTTEEIKRLKTKNQKLCERLEKLEETISEAENHTDSKDTVSVSRRGTLTALAGLGVLGVGATGTAAATDHDHIGETWEGTPSGWALEMITGDDGLKVESSGSEPVSHAVRGEISSESGRGIFGINYANTGDAYGVFGRTLSSDGNAVYGLASSEGDGLASGLRGISHAERGRGVIGIARSETGPTYGLYGITQSNEGVGLFGNATSETGNTIGLRGRCESPDGRGLEGYNASSDGETIGIYGWVRSDDGYGLYTPDDAKVEKNLEVGGDIKTTSGNLEVEGTKHFVQAVETPTGPKEVVYTSVEAGKPRTEVSDVAEMMDGRAEVELPTHFGMVTSDEEPLVVQVTPYSKEEVQPQVVEKSTEQITIEDFSESSADYTFAYTVKGVREGFEDEQIIRDTE